MTDIFSLPREVMLEILTFLPYSDLISVERTCQQWCDLCKDNKIRRKLATGIQSSWDNYDYWPDAAEVRCAAAMVTTGHLTSVERMQLRNLELPSREDITISSLAKVVRKRVELRNVTGDLGPLLSSLRCAQLYMF